MHETFIGHTGNDDLKNRLYLLLEKLAIEQREVKLASGQMSNIYIDCRQVYFRGEAQFIIGELFFKKMLEMESASIGFAACGGMAMGSIPLSCALSAAAFRRGRELPGFAIRRQAKDHGMMTAIEGDKCLEKGSRVVLVEDVVTTGSSALIAIRQLREVGVVVDTLFAVVDREQGGFLNLLQEGVRSYSLFSLKDLVRQ